MEDIQKATQKCHDKWVAHQMRKSVRGIGIGGSVELKRNSLNATILERDGSREKSKSVGAIDVFITHEFGV